MTAIEDRLALRALADEYAEAVDVRSRDRFAGVFTADAELAIFEPGEDEPAVVYRGEEELRSVIGLVEAYAATFHFVGNHTCTIGADAATGLTYCTAHHLNEPADGDPFDIVMLIRYRDTYLRQGDGWRFSRRDVLRAWTDTVPAERARLF